MLALAGTSIVLIAGAGALLYRSIHSYLVGQFDVNLRSKATAISSLASVNEHGELEFEHAEAAALERQMSQDGACFYVIRQDDGRLFAWSKSLGGNSTMPII